MLSDVSWVSLPEYTVRPTLGAVRIHPVARQSAEATHTSAADYLGAGKVHLGAWGWWVDTAAYVGATVLHSVEL